MAEAHAPDADRVVPNAPAQIPGWLVHLFVLPRLLARKWAFASARRHVFALPSGIHDRSDPPLASVQALAASIRGAWQFAIARMCLRRGFGPGHQDRPEMSRAIVAFRGSAQGFRSGLPACGLQWWKDPEIVPGMIGTAKAAPPADAMAMLLSRNNDFDEPPPGPDSCACRNPACRGAGTNAPECAPDLVRRPDRLHTRINNSIRSSQRDRAMAGPAILIRAAAMPRSRAPIPPKQSCLLPPARVMCLGAKKVSSRTSSG